MPDFTIVPFTDPESARRLAEAARAEGFGFLDRLIEDWESGKNRFDEPGEAMFGAYLDGELVGTAGLTRERDDRGRVRRVYVHPDHRGGGIATALVAAVLDLARRHYGEIVLFTDTERAARLYERIGFEPCLVEGDVGRASGTTWPATHRLGLSDSQRDSPRG